MDVREYLTADGRNPYRDWMNTLGVSHGRIQATVLRFPTGNPGHRAGSAMDGYYSQRCLCRHTRRRGFAPDTAGAPIANRG
jgi:hypothetical protein